MNNIITSTVYTIDDNIYELRLEHERQPLSGFFLECSNLSLRGYFQPSCRPTRDLFVGILHIANNLLLCLYPPWVYRLLRTVAIISNFKAPMVKVGLRLFNKLIKPMSLD